MPKFYAHVFGKGEGCSKCTALKRRLSALIEEKYPDCEMVFHDVLTDQGMVDFLKMEVLNPSRIPALVMGRTEKGDYMRHDVSPDMLLDISRVGYYLGIQTDYSLGGGLITPDMIAAHLEEARSLA